MKNTIPLPSVGEIITEEFMKPYGLSAYKLAKGIDVPVSRIQDILHNRRRITVDTSIRLGKFFGVSERYFLNIQNDIDFREAEEKEKEALARIIPILYSKMAATASVSEG